MSIQTSSRTALPSDEPLVLLEEAADRIGVPVTRVIDLLQEHKLIAVRDHGAVSIPEAFFNEGRVNKFVPGVIALLSDGGFGDEEILKHLFSEDASLPGRPVDALHGHLAREVMRRAQAMAF